MRLLLRIILWWTAVVAGVLVWLPLVRGATQGAAYSWGLAPGVGGRGTGGDYAFLLATAVFVGSLLYLGWRGARQPFHWLLLLFHLPLAGLVLFAAVRDPNALRFQGATIGVDVSLAVVGPILFCGFAALALFWVVRDLTSGRVAERIPWIWTRGTRVRAVLVVALVPIESVLFHMGAIQSGPNLAGVGLVFWQWVMINRMLASSRVPSSTGLLQQRP
jgi:hypothetical protein